MTWQHQPISSFCTSLLLVTRRCHWGRLCFDRGDDDDGWWWTVPSTRPSSFSDSLVMSRSWKSQVCLLDSLSCTLTPPVSLVNSCISAGSSLLFAVSLLHAGLACRWPPKTASSETQPKVRWALLKLGLSRYNNDIGYQSDVSQKMIIGMDLDSPPIKLDAAFLTLHK